MKRPASVTTFGILNIVFAAFGISGIITSIIVFSTPDTGNNPVLRIMRENPAYAVWMKWSLPLGLLTSVVLLIAGIALLRLKSWGRKLSIGYGAYAMFAGLLGIIMNIVFLFPPLLQEAAESQGPAAAGAIGGVIGGLGGGCVGLAYPILLLIFMTRPKVAAAFQPPATPPVIPPAE